MAKKKNSRGAPPAKVAEPKAAFASPFRHLKQLLAARAVENPPKPAAPPSSAAARNGKVASHPSATEAEPVVDEDALLREALLGVRPLAGQHRVRVPREPRTDHEIVSEDAEVIAQLSDLVSGQGPFDISETEEYVEGARVGLDPRLVQRLRRGDFASQSHIDLHGLIQTDARQQLERFIIDSVRKGHRCVLVVHGRGLGSPGGHGVLKHAAAQWLSHGPIGGHVLAFSSARQQDGGAGATYVLLRREKRRGPFDIFEGAKRR